MRPAGTLASGMSMWSSRNPWGKLAAAYIVALPLGAALGYFTDGASGAAWVAAIEVLVLLLTALVLQFRLRSRDRRAD
jgi:uncharacterized membrane protein YfcA